MNNKLEQCIKRVQDEIKTIETSLADTSNHLTTAVEKKAESLDAGWKNALAECDAKHEQAGQAGQFHSPTSWLRGLSLQHAARLCDGINAGVDRASSNLYSSQRQGGHSDSAQAWGHRDSLESRVQVARCGTDHLIINPLVNSTSRFLPESRGQSECRSAAICGLQLNLKW